MYAVSFDQQPHPSAAACLRGTGSTAPTERTLRLVTAAASLLRVALDIDDLSALHEFTRILKSQNLNARDIFAAAQQLVIESITTPLSPAALHSMWKQLLSMTATLLPLNAFDPAQLDQLLDNGALAC